MEPGINLHFRVQTSRRKLPDVLEAAHIFPYKGEPTNNLTNGLLLRADLHILFDSFLISVNPDDFRVWVAPDLLSTEYAVFQDKRLCRPKDRTLSPSVEALRRHFVRAGFSSPRRKSGN